MEKPSLLNAKKRRIKFLNCSYTEESKSKNLELNLYLHRMEQKMILPTGKYYGSLPDYIFFDNAHWTVLKTGDVEGITYDKIKNTVTQQVKIVKRKNFIEFLSKKVDISENSITFTETIKNKICQEDQNSKTIMKNQRQNTLNGQAMKVVSKPTTEIQRKMNF
jgi:hypothetical protein